MNQISAKTSRQLIRLPQKQWEHWIGRMEKSGLTAKAFAQKHDLNCATLRRWKKRLLDQGPSRKFVEVDGQTPPPPMEMVVEHRSGLRLTIHGERQVAWAAALLKELSKLRAC